MRAFDPRKVVEYLVILADARPRNAIGRGAEVLNKSIEIDLGGRKVTPAPPPSREFDLFRQTALQDAWPVELPNELFDFPLTFPDFII